jgi:hypothetical protein
MKFKSFLSIVAVVLFTLSSFAQTDKETELSILLLENDDISGVNVEHESFINAIAKFTDVIKEEFNNVADDQKIGILLVIHKEGKQSVEIHANPELSPEKQNQCLEKLNEVKLEHTKYVDFPMLVMINSSVDNFSKDFKNLILPNDKKVNAYMEADLKKKYELNKAFAIEVLGLLSGFQVIVDDKFEGVKNFGKLVSSSNFKEKQNVVQMTNENNNYWRALVEMSVGNQLIPITKIFMQVSQGEFDYAMKFIQIVGQFSDPKSVPDRYLKELTERLQIFDKQLKGRIEEGIALHDSKEFSKALDVYNAILADYPNSAWTKYEVYFSQNEMAIATKKVEVTDRTEWDIAKPAIYKCDPLYNMDVRLNTGKEAYLMFRRAEISNLFQDSKSGMQDLYKYADIALDIEAYDFAAQLFWLSFTFNKKETDAAFKFLYCLDKMGITSLKGAFKGDIDKEFKKIEKTKQKEMTESAVYKAFKNKE